MRRFFMLIGVFVLLILNDHQAFSQAENTIYNTSSTINSVTATYKGRNACVGNNDFSIVQWYRNGVKVHEETKWLLYDEWFDVTHTFDCKDLAPNSTVSIYVVCAHYYCVTPFPGSYTYTNTSSSYNISLASYNPVSSVLATDSLYGDKVIINWTNNQQFNSHSYKVYRDNSLVASGLAAGTQTYTHSGLGAGEKGTYTVRGVVNGTEVAAPTGNLGSTFNINLRASTTYSDKIVLAWTTFKQSNSPSGYIINRWDGTNSFEIINTTSTTAVAYEDAVPTLIPGFSYRYTIQTLPYSNNIVGVAYGKKTPNGSISGTVKTPTGVGVPGVTVTATLQGAALPSDNTTTYTAVTNSNGEYVINNIYYYTGATFNVVPSFDDRVFNPLSSNVTLNISSHDAQYVNFTDLSSFTVSGNISQFGCPMEGVNMLLNNSPVNVMTDENGDFDLTISSGGNYTITPQLTDHAFSPSSMNLVITSDRTGVDFNDTTKFTLDGYFTASCNRTIGEASIRVFSTDEAPNCFSDTLVTDMNGYFSIKLPARKYKLDLINFVSDNEVSLPSLSVLSYFANEQLVDLTSKNTSIFHNDTLTHNFVYRLRPQLVVSGINDVVTCSDTIYPVLQQRLPCSIELEANESFNGYNCHAGAGYVVITENISSEGMMNNIDTIYYEPGEVMNYTLTPGTPNTYYYPYTKNFTAVLYRDNQTDTVSYEILVLGHNPRSQTFTTVTPQIPFHIIHNPPGDASYSYLETNSSISNSFTTSFLQEGSVDAYVRVQLGPDISISTGFGAEVSADFDTQFDVTGTLGVGVSGLTTDAATITTTASERFETSGNVDIVGGAGDVYVGGAVNLLYSLSDAILFDFDSCKVKKSVVLMMQPKGLETTFMYTESHITDVIIPELQNIVNLYTQSGADDSAAYYQNQLGVWQQIVATNHANIQSAGLITNKTFSGGVSYENSVQTTRTNSHSLEMSYYLDYGVAVEIGASINGVGLYGGVAVSGRSTWGNVAASETSNTTTVGYVLSDDDLGDSYSVNIANDSVYGTPAFRLVAGRSSCPWESGTLPREGVLLVSNSNYQEVEENDQAVFVLQLVNTSQSDEEMTYDLVFDHASNPYGAVLTIGGGPILGNVPYPYTIPAGGSVNVTITVSKGPSAMEYNGLKFTLKSSCDESISESIYLNTKFYKEYDLTLSKVGQGTVFPGEGVNTIREGSNVYLYASPAQGYEFQKWIVGSNVYTDPSINVTINSNISATAYFIESTAPQFTLQVITNGNGTTIPPVGTHYYNSGTSIDLNGIPEMQNAFVKWIINGQENTANQMSLTLNENTVAEAVFVQTRTLRVEVVQGDGEVSPTTGYSIVNDGTTMHLYASPDSGYVFEKWKIGGVEFFNQSHDLTISKDTLVEVYFMATSEPQVMLMVSNIGSGTTNPPMGSHYVVDGSVVTFTAYPSLGQMFDKWMVDGSIINDNPLQVTINGQTLVDAYFKLDDTGLQDEVLSEGSAFMYPNPSDGLVHVVSAGIINSVEVVDIAGKTVYFKQGINSQTLDLNLFDLPNGSYIVKLVSSDDIFALKWQIVH